MPYRQSTLSSVDSRPARQRSVLAGTFQHLRFFTSTGSERELISLPQADINHRAPFAAIQGRHSVRPSSQFRPRHRLMDASFASRLAGFYLSRRNATLSSPDPVEPSPVATNGRLVSIQPMLDFDPSSSPRPSPRPSTGSSLVRCDSDPASPG
ncbi:hypothetical protein BDW75DRAFT_182173 [Aspergillus navahoensis]